MASSVWQIWRAPGTRNGGARPLGHDHLEWQHVISKQALSAGVASQACSPECPRHGIAGAVSAKASGSMLGVPEEISRQSLAPRHNVSGGDHAQPYRKKLCP